MSGEELPGVDAASSQVIEATTSRIDPKVLPLEALALAAIAEQRAKNPNQPYIWSA